jgi:non-canonical (house-cleaning) NTP pyrophosphatase
LEEVLVEEVEEDWAVVVDLEVEVVSAVGLVPVGVQEAALAVALERAVGWVVAQEANLAVAVGSVVVEASGVALEVAVALVVVREPVVGSVSELDRVVGSELVVEPDLEED